MDCNSAFNSVRFLTFRKNNPDSWDFLAFYANFAKVAFLGVGLFLAVFVLFIAIRGDFLQYFRGVWAVF